MISMFIFEEILCHWGVLEEIVTGNSPAFVKALNWLAELNIIVGVRATLLF
jgi:hypothetical protein